jgi:3-phenylpropionate/cinnamic acid dioxygenase small subunit
MSPIGRAEADELLSREAMLLDTGDWDGWLELYCRGRCLLDAGLARRGQIRPQDPDSELSLIYYQGRQNLADRVWRARSGLSVASAPRPRVVHSVTNVLVLAADEAEASLSASFAVHLYDVRAERTHIFFGRYEHRLRREAEGWRIAAKKILLLNDVIPTVVDFYSI